MHEKTALRAELTVRRAGAFAALPDAGVALVARFPADIMVDKKAIVAGFMPFRTEIDPLPLLRHLRERGAQVVMPLTKSPSHLWGRVGMGGTVSDRKPALEASTTAPHPPAPSPQVGRGEALTFHLCDIENGSDFKTNKWGLCEPKPDLPVATPNILLVPLLGFDRQGYRLGYGKGYYDQALAALRTQNNIIAVGLAFSAQEVPEIPTQPHDQRLDWIITQNEAYRVLS